MSELEVRREATPAQQLVAQIRGDAFQQQIADALPGTLTPARFVRAASTALLQNPDLAKAEPDSLFASVLKCAQDGLLPDGREAALVMYGKQAVYIPMIGGFRKIAGEHGWSIQTRVVFQNDEFEYSLGLKPDVKHHPVRPGVERGPLVAAYAIGLHGDGREEVEVMYADEIEKIRKVSRASSRGPWVDWFERMAEKTVGRRLFAKLPLGDLDEARRMRMLTASELDPGEATTLIYGPDHTHAAAPLAAIEAPADSTPSTAAESTPEPVDVQQPSAPEPAADGNGGTAGSGDFSGEEPGDASDFNAPATVGTTEAMLAAQGAGLHVITFGKYADRTIAQVGENDAPYVEWMASRMDPKTPAAHAARSAALAWLAVYGGEPS